MLLDAVKKPDEILISEKSGMGNMSKSIFQYMWIFILLTMVFAMFWPFSKLPSEEINFFQLIWPQRLVSAMIIPIFIFSGLYLNFKKNFPYAAVNIFLLLVSDIYFMVEGSNYMLSRSGNMTIAFAWFIIMPFLLFMSFFIWGLTLLLDVMVQGAKQKHDQDQGRNTF